MPDLGLLAPVQPASPVQSPDLFPFQRFVRRLMPLERVRELHRRAQQPVNRSILENVLTELRVECKVATSDLARVPATGPVVVTANHPFGLLDGAVLGALLSRVRPDIKVLTNCWPESRNCMSTAFSSTHSENVNPQPETGAE